MSSLPFHSDRIRVVIFVKRNESMTQEEFSRHWVEVHTPLFTSLDIVKKNILKFEQGHTNFPLSGKFAEMMQVTTPDFDGIVTLEAESIEKIMEVLGSPEYLQTIVPDQNRMADRSKSQVLVQHVNKVIG